MRSNVIVGNGAEAEMVVEVGEQESMFLARTSWLLGLMIWRSELGIEPERSMDIAADVVDAIFMAAGGRGWL